MTKIQRRVLTSFALVMGLTTSGLAYGDSAGDWGRVVSVRVTAQGSDDFAKFRGTLTLAGRRTHPRRPAPTVEYTWGGSTCPGRDLTDGQISQLTEAMTHRAHLRIKPYFKPGQGSAKCIVGFEAAGREATGEGGGPS